MMPWNPIHRYAGLQSSIDPITSDPAASDVRNSDLTNGDVMNGVTSDPFGNAGSRDVDVSFGHATGIGSAAGAEPSRRPLGFVDVRSEGGDGSMDEFESTSESDSGPDERVGLVGEIQFDDPDAGPEEKVPFFKREISFGRKKESEPVADVTTEADDANAEVEGVAESTVEPTAPIEPIAVDDVDVPVGADEKVPFFKRELSLRRKRDDAETTAIPVAAESDAVEPDDIEPLVIETQAVEIEAAEPEAVEPEPEPEPEVVEPEVVESLVAQAGNAADDEDVAAQAEVNSEVDSDAPVYDLEEISDVTDVADGLEWPEQAAAAAEIASPEPSLDPETESAETPDPPQSPETPIAITVTKAPRHKRELSFGKSGKSKTSSGGRGGQRRSGKVVGLKIGASQLAAAVVEDQNGRPELVELARSPLEAGIVVDGEIRDPEALTHALRAFFADHKLPTKDVRIGIASNRIGVRTFEIAGVEDGARFDNAVRFKAHEVLPIAGSESVLDYRVLDERQSPTGETIRRILLVVAPRDQVAPYAEAAQRAGLKLAGIDLESLGLLRAFVEPQNPGDRKATDTATVVVAIGHEASTLMVSGGGVCEFTRVFDWGGTTLQEAITQELDVRPAEAATILRHLSLAGNSSRIEGLDDDARNKAVEAVRLRLTPFARELVSSLQFYQTQPDSLGIGEIVITGGASQLDGLADALHQMIGVAVRVGDPLQRVAARKGVETGFEHVIGSLAVAIGLGIDDGAIRSVNLMPGDLAKVSTRKPRLLPVLLPIAAVVPLAAVGFLFLQAHGKVTDRQSQLATLNSEFASLPQPKVAQIDTALRGIQAERATAVAQVLGARTAWDTMLADFARVLPSNVWLTALSAKTSRPLTVPTVVAAATTTGAAPAAPVVTTTVSPTGVTINGFTYAQPDVAALLARLAALPSLQNVQLQSSQVAQVGKRDVVQFTILADLRETGGGS